MNTIRNQILECVKERVLDIVNGAVLRTSVQSIFHNSCSLSGVYAFLGYRRYKVVKNGSNLDFTRYYEEKASEPVDIWSAPIANSIPIVDTGVSLIIDMANLPNFVDGDTIDIRMNDCGTTVREATRFEKVQSNRVFPYVQILPMDEKMDKHISDRYYRSLEIALEFRCDRDVKYYSEMEELIGDIETEIQRDHHLFGTDKQNSLCYELEFIRIQNFDTEYDEYIGGMITLLVKYRTSEHDSRVKRN